MITRKLEIKHPRLIICEGEHDASFLREMNSTHSLPDSNVFSLAKMNENAGGRGMSFQKALVGLRLIPGFNLLQDLILMRDSDSNATTSFDDIVRQVRAASQPGPGETAPPYPIPTAPHVKAAGTPSVTILMIPWHNRNGALETLCYEAAIRPHPAIKTCIDAFIHCCGVTAWPIQKQDKARLRAFISGHFRDRPDMSLGYAWKTDPTLIPLTDIAFDDVKNFLQTL